jgi:hypothetical protein
MSKAARLSSFAEKHSSSPLLSALLAFGLMLPASAQAGTGKWRAATCGAAQSQFVQLTGKQSDLGFLGSNNAVQLIQTGSGTAGATVHFKYSAAPPTEANDFVNLHIFFNPDGEGVKKNTTLQFCFLTNHGKGKTLSFSLVLKNATISDGRNGFKEAFVGPEHFPDLKVRDFVLHKLTFLLNDPGRITIGETNLQVGPGNKVHPANINLTAGSCNSLFTCEDEDN